MKNVPKPNLNYEPLGWMFQAISDETYSYFNSFEEVITHVESLNRQTTYIVLEKYISCICPTHKYGLIVWLGTPNELINKVNNMTYSESHLVDFLAQRLNIENNWPKIKSILEDNFKLAVALTKTRIFT